jgi:hypothetical protein
MNLWPTNRHLSYVRMWCSETFGFPPPLDDPNEIAAKAFTLGIAAALVVYGAVLVLIGSVK